MRQRDREIQRDRERKRDTETQRDTDRDRDRETERETEREDHQPWHDNSISCKTTGKIYRDTEQPQEKEIS